MTLRYRPDIDGLRAVAVLAVILFHAGWGMPGGFVGVDVFFVISGYLITSLLCADLDRGTFSLLGFWERRIRRIWPASLATTLCVLAAGWVMLLPLDFKATAGDAIAQMAMIVNVRFVQHVVDGYFAESSDLRPLLHLWSLAVEEQFYLALPLVLMACWRLGRGWCVAVLSCAAAGSLVASQSLLSHRPSEVFFLAPFRAWELLVGALVAFAPWGTTQGWKRPVRAVAAPGMALVLAPMFAYSRTTPFPAVSALAPCLGAALVIVGGSDPGRASLVSRFLATPLLVGIGRMSYSLYLWHWPVLAFLRYALGVKLSVPATAAALAFVFAAAYASWRLIEQPFRRGRHTAGRRGLSTACVLVAAVTASAAIVVVSAWVRWRDGVPSRFEPQQVRFADSCRDDPGARRFIHDLTAADGPLRLPAMGSAAATGDVDGRPDFLLWGDSHALCIAATVDALAGDLGMSGAAAIVPATIPVPNAWWPASRWGAVGAAASQAWADGIVAWIRERRPRHVVLCAAWSSYVPPGNGRGIEAVEDDGRTLASSADVLRRSLEILSQVCEQADADLWILEDVPFQARTCRERAVIAHLARRPIALRGVDRETHARQQEAAARVIRSLAGGRVHVRDLAAPFFEDDGVSRVGSDDRAWYADGSHLTAFGAEHVLGGVLREVLEDLARGGADDR